MAMSRDRVEFKLAAPHSQRCDVQRAADRAFGHGAVKVPSRHADTPVIVRCRPSQFARFLIYRNEEGASNSFRELDARLVEEDCKQFVDVSANPRQC